jgi:nucleoside-diphosphate-sugar epimerase
VRVAVVGATGNLGTALLRRLVVEPAVTSLAGVSRRPPGATPAPPFDAVDWLSVDIGDAAAVPALTAHLRGADAVVHLAWRIQPTHDESLLWRTNVDGTRHVLAAAAAAGVPHVVVASSVGAYSPASKDAPVDETWPTDGIRSSAYSREKVVVERLLDLFEHDHPDVRVARLRPGLVFAGDAASEIARFFLGPFVPTSVLGRLRLPFLPLPRQLQFPAVHADDVAAAFWTVLAARATGAFNVAAEPVLTPPLLARALGAGGSRHVPLPLVRALAALTWKLRLQPSDAGWVDIASQCPTMRTDRIEALGWRPTRSATSALDELVEGMRTGRGGPGPALRRRGAVTGRAAR